MNDGERAAYEKKVSLAVLAMWIFFDSEVKQTGRVDYLAFKSQFDQHVRPAMTQVYGTSRKTLADRYGHAYTERATPTGSVVTIPNLSRTIDDYAADLYESFTRRHVSDRQRESQAEPDDPPVAEYGQEDADRWAVTNVTSAKARGEMDAAADIESSKGIRLVAYWKTEPGACKKCAALEGQPWRVWRLVFPNGPPAHPHCRCDLVWREMLV